MCTTRILTQTNKGIVIECQSCNAIQVIFGTAKMEFKYEAFELFIESVQSKVQSTDNNSVSANTKSIIINHPICAGFSFILNHSEVNELLDLITSADLLHEAYNILKTEQ